MCRVAIVIAGSLLATGCSSFSPSDLLSSFGGAGYPLKLESDPPGAEARTSLGPTCRTPCTIAVPARDDFAVTFALAGYEAQTVPVSIVRSGGFGSDSMAVQFFPNPVQVELEAAAPPPVAKKKPKPRAKTGAKPAAKAAAAKPAAAKPPAQSGGAAIADNTQSAQRATAPASAWPPPSRQ